MADLPVYLWIAVLIGTVGFPAAVAVGLYRMSVDADAGGSAARRVVAGFGVVWTAWTLLSVLLASAGAYRNPNW